MHTTMHGCDSAHREAGRSDFTGTSHCADKLHRRTSFRAVGAGLPFLIGDDGVSAQARRFPVPPDGAAGFTLLELLVVLVIIGLLAGYVGPRYFSQLGKSEAKVARAQMDAIEKALDHYRLDVGRYPTTEQGLAGLYTRPQSEPKWAGPYLKKEVPPDPWGRPYQYRSPGQHGEYDLLSFGKDGQPGGTAEAADITSW
jgi:general secretion pathway protein G